MKRNLLKLAVFLFAAVVSVSAMSQTVVLQDTVQEAADTYKRKGDYQLVNQWIRSSMGGNYAKTDLGGSGLVRGMVAKDGKMYFCRRNTEGGAHSIIVVDGVTGKYEKTITLSENIFTRVEVDSTGAESIVSACTLPNNDIKLDDNGNFLVGPCYEGGVQHFQVYKVNIETGECTELINEVIVDNPKYADLSIRLDAFGVWGNVEDYAVVMAMNANAMNCFRWVIKNGVASPAELITLDTFYEGGKEKNPGSAPQIIPISENLFYVDGNATYPTLYDATGTRVDCFYDYRGSKLPILGTMNQGHNGIVEFELKNDDGETEYFMCCAATNTDKAPQSSFAIIKCADKFRSLQTAELIYQFPSNGFGANSNPYRSAPVSVEVIDNIAHIYCYVGENGFAHYIFTEVVSSVTLLCNNNYGNVIGSGKYGCGENVTIEAIPNEGYCFVEWSDGDTNAIRTITVTEDITLTAEFVPCYVVETHYNGEQGGVIGGDKYIVGDTATLIATAFDGYDFDYWEIYELELVETYWGTEYQYVYKGTSTDDTITFVVDKNYAYIAYFKVVPILIDGVYYELKYNSTACVYPYEYTGDIVIPSSVVYEDKNYDVEQIYEDAFAGTSITSLTVSNGLYGIDLSGCDNLVALKANIDFIGACRGLNSLKGLKEIYVTSGTLVTGNVRNFNFLNLLQISTLEVLDLSKVENTELSPEMFKETYLEDVYDYYYGYYVDRVHLSLKNLRKLVLPEGLTKIHERQFESLWMLEEIVIPEGVTEIPDGAFYDCHALAKVEFNENLTSIGKYAFYSCHALENIVIPEGVTEIGDAAFYGCNYADEIVIASSVERIGNNAFALCNQVERMEVRATIPPSIKAKTFYQVNRNIEFVVPVEVRNAYAEDIYWGEFIQKVPTDIDATNAESFVIYTQDGMLYVEGVEADYNVFDAAGRLVYTGRDAQLQLPRGVYVVTVGGKVEKVVI